MNEGFGRVSVPRISDEPYLRLIEDQPMNWLPEGPWDSWDEWVTIQILAAIEADVESPWEESNRIVLESPLASMAPDAMKSMLQIDIGPQSGHWFAPKVLTPGIGASARLVVSPGHEADGILLTPGGQSGNPLSPHYRSLTDTWAEGEALPFLPGESVATFELQAK
jgi:penicillin amidase